MEWVRIQQSIVACQRCPRLRKYCRAVAAEKRPAFREQTYWGKPVPNFGSPEARLLIVGLAPAAHGANRTGRMFTGDRSGDFLFAAMHAEGFANQPTSVSADDGLELIDAAITAIIHCAPPANKPTPGEIANCVIHFSRTVDAMPNLRGFLALGKIAFDGCVRMFIERGWIEKANRPVFAHGASYRAPGRPFLLACYHPSQQNTFTGKLTAPMMRQVFATARAKLDRS
ncbi:MAG TPA: uracil-DNA glycosylase [Tepidisphaeraceae bacterium]|jgi:uracil-DNA glycosylase family 4|nr:uracil-DNA glycosylase [Tepidisphaeraceae bacterium]